MFAAIFMVFPLYCVSGRLSYAEKRASNRAVCFRFKKGDKGRDRWSVSFFFFSKVMFEDQNEV
ncbi:hypothetical protein [Bacillus stratosphericus]|uniref:hypothetical protein n=1 Tax=Bacillus stratosphericus TaxID=293386 RepID=UPI001CFA8D2E|nr:hypothetical protein [Bacillus stratosphericus]